MDNEEQSKRSKLIAWGLIGLSLVILYGVGSLIEIGPTALGRYTAWWFALLLLTMFVLALVGKGQSRQTKAKLDQAAGAIMIVCVSGILLYANDQKIYLTLAKQEAAEAVKNLEGTISLFETQSNALPKSDTSTGDAPPKLTSPAPSRTETPPPPQLETPASQSKLSREEFLRASMALVREVTARQKASLIAYDRSTTDLALESLLTPETLVSQVKLADATQRLGKFRATFDSYMRDQATQAASFRKAFTELALRTANGQAEIEGFDRGRTRVDALTADFKRNQTEMLALMTDVHKLARSQLGHTKVSGAQIMFESEDALNRYNQLIEKIQPLAEEEARINEQTEAHYRATTEKLKRFAN